jgi:hypothetical protein
VLLSIEEYRRLTGGERDLVDLLSMDEDIDFEPERLGVGLRELDL